MNDGALVAVIAAVAPCRVWQGYAKNAAQLIQEGLAIATLGPFRTVPAGKKGVERIRWDNSAEH